MDEAAPASSRPEPPPTPPPPEPVPESKLTPLEAATQKLKAAQKPTEEPKDAPPLKVEPKEEAKPEPKDSQRFAALAKKEAALVKKGQENKAKEAELSARLAKAEAFEKILANAKADPNAYASAAGLTFEEIVEFNSRGGQPDPVKLVRQELAEFKKQLAEEQKKTAEAQAQQLQENQQKAIAKLQADCEEFPKSNAEEFKLINANPEYSPSIFAVIEARWKESGGTKVVTIKEAALEVEEYLKKKFQPVAPTPPAKTPPPAIAAKPVVQPIAPPKTLTNNMTASTHPQVLDPKRSMKERLERAILIAEGKL